MAATENLAQVLNDMRKQLEGVNLFALSKEIGVAQTTLHRFTQVEHDPKFSTVVEIQKLLKARGRKPLPITPVRKKQKPADPQ